MFRHFRALYRGTLISNVDMTRDGEISSSRPVWSIRRVRPALHRQSRSTRTLCRLGTDPTLRPFPALLTRVRTDTSIIRHTNLLILPRPYEPTGLSPSFSHPLSGEPVDEFASAAQCVGSGPSRHWSKCCRSRSAPPHTVSSTGMCRPLPTIWSIRFSRLGVAAGIQTIPFSRWWLYPISAFWQVAETILAGGAPPRTDPDDVEFAGLADTALTQLALGHPDNLEILVHSWGLRRSAASARSYVAGRPRRTRPRPGHARPSTDGQPHQRWIRSTRPGARRMPAPSISSSPSPVVTLSRRHLR